MADLFGALAQSIPAATTLTDGYTVPTARRATVSVNICNHGSAAVVRLSHATGGAADALGQYLLRDFALSANNSVSTVQLALAAGDVLRVYSDTGNVSFNINGIEEDA